jgi:hypothetical protein
MANSENSRSIPSDSIESAASYLIFLGLLNLVVLNLAGLLYLHFAPRIRRHNNRVRIAAMWICGLQSAAGLVIFLVVAFRFAKVRLMVAGTPVSPTPLLLASVAILVTILYGIPVLMLGSRETRYAFKCANHPSCCVNCGYDLRATPNRCPECGTLTDSSPSRSASQSPR